MSKVRTYWTGFKSKSPLSFIGIGFLIMGLIAIIPISILGKVLKEPQDSYDYEAIIQHGTRVKAHVTGVDIKTNITVNGAHPFVISYEYASQDATLADKFQTLDVDAAASLGKKDSILVYVLNGQSAIPNLKSFQFPFDVFFIIPGIFLLIGLVFSFIGHLAGMRKLRESISL